MRTIDPIAPLPCIRERRYKERTNKMLADYKLYWDPKSNLIFFPAFETEAVGETQPRGFAVERFRPCGFLAEKGYRYPSFEAVLLASFGTWGIFEFGYEDILKALTSPEGPEFKDADVRDNFRKFLTDNPKFKDTRYAAKEECVDSIPRKAIYVPEA